MRPRPAFLCLGLLGCSDPIGDLLARPVTSENAAEMVKVCAMEVPKRAAQCRRIAAEAGPRLLARTPPDCRALRIVVRLTGGWAEAVREQCGPRE